MKNRDEARIEKGRQDDFITNRILFVFAMAFVAIIGLTIRNYFRSYFVETYYTMTVLALVFAFGFAVGIIKEVVDIKRGRDNKYRLLRGSTLGIMCAIYAIISFIARYFEYMHLLYVVVPTLFLLYLIFFIYQREFFAIATVCGCGCISSWVLCRLYGNSYDLDKAVVISLISLALLLLGAVFVYYLHRHSGGLKLFGTVIPVFPKLANYTAVYIAFAVVTLAMLAPLVLSFSAAALAAQAAYIAIFGAGGVLFVFAVYFTVKLM